MSSRIVACLVLALFSFVPLTQAGSLGEAINSSLGSNSAAALADLPPEALGALHAASSLLQARSMGLVSERNAATALAALADELADAHPRIDELEDEAYRVALILESRVVVAGARELVRVLPAGVERASLLASVSRLVEAGAAGVARRVHAGAGGPDNPCFQQYGACMEFCSELADFINRSLCGMDCNLDFAACLGRSVGRGIGDLIGVFDDSLSAPLPTGGR